MALHTQSTPPTPEALPLSNKVLSEVFLPMAPDTAFVAYFGHLMGYDAGYYGYAGPTPSPPTWPRFEKAPNGYYDTRPAAPARRDLRPGRFRDADVSIEKFLGRKRSLEPFLRKLGIDKKQP